MIRLLCVSLAVIFAAHSVSGSKTQIYINGCLPGTQHASSLHCLTQENKQLREEARRLRKELGELSCRCDDLGPSGAFCLTADKVSVGGNDYLDATLVDALVSLVNGTDVLDLGCGLGQYGKALKSKGIDWTGYDGSERVEEVTDGLVRFIDLGKPHWLGKQYGWVLSLEVGEHLPTQITDVYVANLKRHAKCGIVLSWAIPGQEGHHHVNNKSNENVISLIEEGGDFSFNTGKSDTLRTRASLNWLKETLMVFDAKGCPVGSRS